MSVNALCRSSWMWGNCLRASTRCCSSKEFINSNDFKLEAEKIVGYSSSFLNLRYLLNDEIANAASYLRKLSDVQHPILKIAKKCWLKNDTSWGLIVLLIAKAAGSKNLSSADSADSAGILHKQRILAEVTEMMRTSLLIHKGILTVDQRDENADTLNYGNKIALLSGDYLLSRCYSNLASLANLEVHYVMSSALRDLTEGELLSEKKRLAEPHNDESGIFGEETIIDQGPYNVVEIVGNSKDEWLLRNLLGGANLLAKSCYCALLLAGHEQPQLDQAYLFGKHLALAWQTSIDYEDFTSSTSLNIFSAPIMLYLTKHPDFYDDMQQLTYHEIREIVTNGSTLDETLEMKKTFSTRANKNLECFDCASSKAALKKLILSL